MQKIRKKHGKKIEMNRLKLKAINVHLDKLYTGKVQREGRGVLKYKTDG